MGRTGHPNPGSAFARLAWPTDPSKTSWKICFLQPGPTLLGCYLRPQEDLREYMLKLSHSPFSQLIWSLTWVEDWPFVLHLTLVSHKFCPL